MDDRNNETKSNTEKNQYSLSTPGIFNYYMDEDDADIIVKVLEKFPDKERPQKKK